ncbi:MAG: hypothetical protein A2Z34_06695 [Planctomycetes bacterium RBG_16_59_8]|nr:MAG: hypothetical protein A2Z34_06695 [Planctomycetes bacterium RBG_16_59_8]
MKTISRHILAILFVGAIVQTTSCRLSTTPHIPVEPVAIVAQGDYDIDGDGEQEQIGLFLIKGRRYNDDESWDGAGEKWEGQFSLRIDRGGKMVSETNVNRLFDLDHDASSNIFFWTPSFPLVLMDYNGDGQIDFNLGLYGSSNGNFYKIFTISPDGTISVLPFAGREHGVFLDPPHGVQSTKKMTKEKYLLTFDYYDNIRGKRVTEYWQWKQNRFELFADFEDVPAVREQDLPDMGVGAIPLLEEMLSSPANDDLDRLNKLISLLGDDIFSVRQKAADEICARSPGSLSIIAARLAETESPGVRYRLNVVAQSLEQKSSRLEKMLETLYGEHFQELFDGRWKALVDDPRNESARLFFRHVKYDLVWPKLHESSLDHRLRYLLFLVDVSHGIDKAVNMLVGYPGDDLLRVAGETYWPIELEPLALNGAYHWSSRAATLKDNVATNVIKVSIEKRYGSGKTIHFIHHVKWVYLWKNQTPYCDSKGMVLGLNQFVERTDNEVMTIREYARCEHVQSIPDGVNVPTVHVSDREMGDWSCGAVYSWAKEIFPLEYRDMVSFSDSPYSDKAVILGEPATQPR